MGTLNEDLTAIKAVEDKLTANKVANFAYTDHAYNNPLTEADGVEAYDVDNEQNIPVANASILKVNTTVLTKGWRSQASAITRMLMNHFLGRCSYNLNKINDLMSSLLTTFISHLGTANGVATLDSNGRIPYSQLPESAVELKGYWNASTNTPTLADGTGTNGDEYFVDTAGEQNLGSGTQYFKVGDRVVYTGGVWKNIDSGSVRTVNTLSADAQGNVQIDMNNGNLWTKKWLGRVFGHMLGRAWKHATFPYSVLQTEAVEKVGDLLFTWSKDPTLKVMYCSEDGITWSTCVENGQAFAGKSSCLAYINGYYISSVGGWVAWSSDGVNWTKYSDTLDMRNTIAIVNFKDLIVCAYTGTKDETTNLYTYHIAWTADGQNWTEGTFDYATTSLNVPDYTSSIACNDSTAILCVSVGLASGGNAYSTFSSTNGKDWYAGKVGGVTIVGGMPKRAKYMKSFDLWFVGFQGGTTNEVSSGLYYSADGVNWTKCLDGYIVIDIDRQLAENDGVAVFVVTPDSKTIYYSSDGMSWTQATINGASVLGVSTLVKVIYGNGIFIACSYGGNSSGCGLWYSYDAVTWNRIASGSPIYTADIYDIIYANGTYLITSRFVNKVYWSNNGIDWNEVNSTKPFDLYISELAVSYNAVFSYIPDLGTFFLSGCRNYTHMSSVDDLQLQ